MNDPLLGPSHRAPLRLSIAASALALAVAACTAPSAEAATAPTSDERGQVQAMLDRVLGPGRSIVTVTDAVRTGTTQVQTLRYGAAVPTSTSLGGWSDAAGSSVTRADTAAVDSTSTSVVVPAGALVRRSVAVVIDRSALGATPVSRVKRLIATAAALVPSRGDRLTVTVMRFAPVRAAAIAGTSWTAVLQPFAVPAMWLGGALVALLVLVRAFGGRGRRAVRTP